MLITYFTMQPFQFEILMKTLILFASSSTPKVIFHSREGHGTTVKSSKTLLHPKWKLQICIVIDQSGVSIIPICDISTTDRNCEGRCKLNLQQTVQELDRSCGYIVDTLIQGCT